MEMGMKAIELTFNDLQKASPFMSADSTIDLQKAIAHECFISFHLFYQA
jgi:hypothetical protein